jgi:cell division protein ZapE
MPSAFRSEYERQITAHRIEYEADQDDVVAALDRLSNDIAVKRTSGGLLGHRGGGQIKGVYIWGKVGRGKSMLMNLFYDRAPEPLKRRLHFHAFMQEVHAAMRPPEGENHHEDPIAQAAASLWGQSHLLCLDELEVIDIADAMILGRLFDRLFEHGLVLVATSNDHPDNLYRNGPNRELFAPFVERLKQHVDVIQLGGAHDHRSDGEKDEAAYLCPITIETTRRFDLLWRQTLKGQQEQPVSVDVHGRRLRFIRCCGMNLRVTFEEVCRRPHSADDHLAIADRFNSIFLEELQVIPQDGVDEGRRLVTFIDALYESKARLVALAAAAPEHIFEQLGSEDQCRTVSRLIEMRNGRTT